MKRYIILATVCIIITSCRQANSKKNDADITSTEEVADTLYYVAKCDSTAKEDVEILLDSVLLIRNDTVYSNYRVTNNTPENLLFFHLNYLNIQIGEKHPETDYPNCDMQIISLVGELPKVYLVQMQGTEEKNFDHIPYSYVLLRTGESKYFQIKEYIGNYYLIGKDFALKINNSAERKKEQSVANQL